MKQKIETIIKYIIGAEKDEDSLAKLNIPAQFRLGEEDTDAVSRNLNAAFLISLLGEAHPLYSEIVTLAHHCQQHNLIV